MDPIGPRPVGPNQPGEGGRPERTDKSRKAFDVGSTSGPDSTRDIENRLVSRITEEVRRHPTGEGGTEAMVRGVVTTELREAFGDAVTERMIEGTTERMLNDPNLRALVARVANAVRKEN